MTKYNLRKSGTTSQLHIFKTKQSNKGGCIDEALVSVCREVNINDTHGILLSCLSEEEIKTECSKLESQVCSDCISHLYGGTKLLTAP